MENFETIKKILKILEKYNYICPKGCYKCEMKEGMVLLPTEEKFWKYNDEAISFFNYKIDGFFYLSSDGINCPFFEEKKCSIYSNRPIDCRMFPLYPYFDIIRNKVFVKSASSYCPKINNLPSEFTKDISQVILILNLEMPKKWKVLYNEVMRKKDISNVSSLLPPKSSAPFLSEARELLIQKITRK